MLRATFHNYDIPTIEYSDVGFRVAEVDPTRGGTIPTVSEWGLVAMAFLVLTAGTVLLVRRRAVIAR